METLSVTYNPQSVGPKEKLLGKGKGFWSNPQGFFSQVVIEGLGVPPQIAPARTQGVSRGVTNRQ